MKTGGAPSPVEAAAEIAAYLESLSVPYVIIGGLAVQFWSEPRATRDVDVSVMIPEESLDAFIQQTVQRFEPRLSNTVTFARQSRVLLIRAGNGIPVDISFGIPGYEEEVLEHGHRMDLPGGRSLQVIGCNDLIIYKCLAGRPRDLEDVHRILERQEGRVDIAYIRQWLNEFAPLAPEHDVVADFEQALVSSNKPAST